MLNMQGNSAVETPLRWLADNVNNDHSWMMMDMDFAQDFQAHMFSVDGNVSQRQEIILLRSTERQDFSKKRNYL